MYLFCVDAVFWLVLASRSAVAVPLNFSVIATSFDLSSKDPANCIGHFDLSQPIRTLQSNFSFTPSFVTCAYLLEGLFFSYQSWASVLGSGMTGDWEYAVVTSYGATTQAQVFNIFNKTRTSLCSSSFSPWYILPLRLTR